MTPQYFNRQTLEFLRMLRDNNNRDWFTEHKPDYERLVRTPALQLIDDIRAGLQQISPHFSALARKLGGSLMRINRDVRFGRDKRPYKTNIGIQFRHEQGKDVHAPGFYLHIEPDEYFIGVGIWRPDSQALYRIREALDMYENDWIMAVTDHRFRNSFDLAGDSLKRPPRGYPGDHALIDDLKRKDFIAISPVTENDICSQRLRPLMLERFRQADGFMRFLCRALMLRY